MARRIQSVAELNQPSSRAKKKSARSSGPAAKPMRKQETSALKRRPDASGPRLVARNAAPAREKPSADVIDFAASRVTRRAA
jgi:hypothetical protein